MRQNGIEEISELRTTGGGGAGRRVLVLAVAGVVVAGVLVATGFVLFRAGTAVPQKGELAVLDSQSLVRVLRARGVPADALIDPFESGPELRKLIDQIKPNGQQLQAVTRAAVAVVAPKLKSVRVDLMGNLDEPVRTAEQLARALNRGQVHVARSLELALLMTAILRAHELVAVVCEAHEQDGPLRAADPSGALGRFVVAVYPQGQLGRQMAAVLDPARAAVLPAWDGGGGDSAMKSRVRKPRPLGDGSVAGRLLGLRALWQIQHDPDEPEQAYASIQYALKASAPSAALHMLRALVLARAGGGTDAEGEARMALRLRSDAPRRTVFARLLVARGEIHQARDQLKQALAQDKTFWPAYQGLAGILWMLGDIAGGDAALQQAATLAGDDPTVLALEATRKLRDKDLDGALADLEQAGQALEGRQAKQQITAILLQVYAALQGAKRTDDAQRVREKILAMSEHQDQAKAQLERMDTLVKQRAKQSNQAPEPPPASDAPPQIKLPDVSLDPGTP